MKEFYQGHSLEDDSIEGQRALLLDIQEHLLDDKYSDLMNTVNDIVASSEDAEKLFENYDFVRPVASVQGKTSSQGAFYEVYSIRFIGNRFAGGGLQSENFDVPVMEAIGESVLPIKGFSAEEAELFADHVYEVRYAKEHGLLPNIRADLSSVSEPLTAITMKPPDPKK